MICLLTTNDVDRNLICIRKLLIGGLAVSSWITVKTYTNRPEAEMYKNILEQNGIPAIVRVDDSGGMRPAFAFTSGVDLQVRDTDLAKAKSLLDEE